MMTDRDDTEPDLHTYTLKLWIASGIAIATALILTLLWYGLVVPLMFFTGLLLALALRTPTVWISRHTGLPPTLVLAIILIVLSALAAVFIYFFSSHLQQQLQGLAQVLVSSLSQLKEKLNQLDIPLPFLQQEQSAETTSNLTGKLISGATQTFSSLLTVVMHLVVILFIGLFIAFEPDLYRSGFLGLFPHRKRPFVNSIIKDIENDLSRWLLGRIIDMLIVGIMIWVGLKVLGVPLAPSLAVIAALLTFIPNLGPVLSVIPAFLAGYSESSQKALYVVFLYLGVQTVESYLIIPFIQQKAVKIQPALLLIAQILFALMAGVLGLFVAAPVVVMARTLVRRLYLEKFIEPNASG